MKVQDIRSIKDLLSKDDLEGVYNAITGLGVSPEFNDDAHFIRGRLNDIERENLILRTTGDETYRIERNRIRYAYLNLIKNIESFWKLNKPEATWPYPKIRIICHNEAFKKIYQDEAFIKKMKSTFIHTGWISILFPELKNSANTLNTKTLLLLPVSKIKEWNKVFLFTEKNEHGILTRFSLDPAFEVSQYEHLAPMLKKHNADFLLPPFPALQIDANNFFVTEPIEKPVSIKTLREAILERLHEETADYSWVIDQIKALLNKMNQLRKESTSLFYHDFAVAINFYQKHLPDSRFEFGHFEKKDNSTFLIWGEEPPQNDVEGIEVVPESIGPYVVLRQENEAFISEIQDIRNLNMSKSNFYSHHYHYIGQDYDEIDEQAFFLEELKRIAKSHSRFILKTKKRLHRNEYLRNILGPVIEQYNTAHDTEIPKPDNKQWEWFAYESLHQNELPSSLSLGDLNLDKLLLFEKSGSTQLAWFDYQDISSELPVLKDYTSLEASIWFRIAASVLPDLSAFSKVFLKLLVTGRINQFQLKLTDPLQNCIANMINTVRKGAYQCYASISTEQATKWWYDYTILLYHELMLNIDRKALKPNYKELIMLYFSTELMETELQEIIL